MTEITVNKEQFLFVEKYRPKKIDEVILPERIKNVFREYVKKGQFPSFLLSGGAGVGKTTIAKALCNEVGAEVLFINGSDEGRSIDTLRTTIKGFASSVSMFDSPKIVIIDEADYMGPIIQPALRSFMEEYSANCRFVLTCNFKNKIIEPLQSRCTYVDFSLTKDEKADMQSQFFKRIIAILEMESIEYDKKVVLQLVSKFFPDYRKTLMELQRYSVSGKIDSGILVNTSNDIYKELFKSLKEKDYKNTRKWVSEHTDIDSVVLFRHMYDQSSIFIDPRSVPNLVLIIADYQFKAGFVADQEINTLAALTSIMTDCQFK